MVNIKITIVSCNIFNYNFKNVKIDERRKKSMAYRVRSHSDQQWRQAKRHKIVIESILNPTTSTKVAFLSNFGCWLVYLISSSFAKKK